MTEFAFSVETIERQVAVDDLKDVASVIHYRMMARDGAPEFSADGYGAVQIGEPDASNFTAFDDVTVEQCKAWTFEALAANPNANRADDAEGDPATAPSIVAEMQAALQAQIDEKKNPSVLPGLPASWAAE